MVNCLQCNGPLTRVHHLPACMRAHTEPQLGPLVSKVVVHSSLGVAAAQLEPSLVVQASPGGLSIPLGMLSGEEYTLARWVGDGGDQTLRSIPSRS
jgi:hypothetical protein